MENKVRMVASIEQIDEWDSYSRAAHDGEASWDQITNALEEAVDEVRFLRESLRDILELISYSKRLPQRWGYEE